MKNWKNIEILLPDDTEAGVVNDELGVYFMSGQKGRMSFDAANRLALWILDNLPQFPDCVGPRDGYRWDGPVMDAPCHPRSRCHSPRCPHHTFEKCIGCTGCDLGSDGLCLQCGKDPNDLNV